MSELDPNHVSAPAGAPEGALIVQQDGALIVDVRAPSYAELRDLLAGFAQLVKAPDPLHTYRLTRVSLWNAAAAGATPDQVVETLRVHARYGLPAEVEADIRAQMGRWGGLVLSRLPEGRGFLLEALDPALPEALARYKSLGEQLEPTAAPGQWRVAPGARGEVKRALAKLGFPVLDRGGFQDGEPLPIALRSEAGGAPFALRPYQREAVDAFVDGPSGGDGGHGVVVLPCGAGKTVVALGALASVQMRALILAPGATAVRQWIRELLDKTTLRPDEVGEYSGQKKEVRPVTVATYQIATRPRHRGLLEDQGWGLIVYDEVHLLPAPLFRTTAELQARRRLGLTATLVREDGRETEVFTLIGPKRYELPWKVLEAQGYVAEARCVELRVEPTEALLHQIERASGQDRYRLAAEYIEKDRRVEALLKAHPGERALIIGQYLGQLQRIAARLGAPLLTGETPQTEREGLFRAFRAGEVQTLVVSRVANFAVDLPDASLLIQVSGLFGSRQEEAQRLGRVLRPKAGGKGAYFYTLVTQDTVDQDFALRRQRFLTEQGYTYAIQRAEPPARSPEEAVQA